MAKSKRFTLPERHLASEGSLKGVFSPLDLEKHVLTYLRRVEKLQEPRDYKRPLRELRVTFDGGVMLGQWKGTDKPLRFTTHGAGQIARQVLPARFWTGFKRLVEINPKRAEGVWEDFSAYARTPVLVRTARRNLGGGNIVRAIRSCHSTKYARYSHTALVEDLVRHSDINGLPVASWSLSTGTMNVKFCAVDEDVKAFAQMVNANLESVMIPTVDVWNSETAKRAVVLVGGAYRVVSATGLPAWGDRARARWEHRGSTTELARRVSLKWTGIQEGAAMVQAAYEEALDIPVENCGKYLTRWLKKHGETETLIAVAIGCLKDPTATPKNTLARCVDALALAAHSCGVNRSGLARQFEIEELASAMLRDGVAAAAKTAAKADAEAEAERHMDEAMAAANK